MRLHPLLLALSSTSFAQLPAVDPPPIPDFKRPVDYRDWYDAQTRALQGSNALDMYGTFLYGLDRSDPEAIAPESGSTVASQLRALLTDPDIWEPAEKPELARWVAATEGRYAAAFLAGADRRHFAARAEQGSGFLADMKLPSLVNGRAVGQMMFARAWRVTDDTFYTGHFLEAIRSNLVFANHMSYGSGLDEQFFAMGHRGFVYDQIARGLPSRILMSDVWRKVIEDLEKHDAVPVTQGYARSLYFSEAATLQLLQHFCTRAEDDNAPPEKPSFNLKQVKAYFDDRPDRGSPGPESLKLLADSDPAVLADAIHRYFDSMRKLLTAPYATDLAAKIRIVESESFGKHQALNTLATPIGLSVQSAFRVEATRRLALLLLKMAVVFKETEIWPQSLDELAREELQACRIDPFSGKDFLLKTVGTRIAPYSVGPNGLDDGGDQFRDVIYWVTIHPDLKPMPTTLPSTQPAATTQPAAATQPAVGAAGDQPATQD